MKYFTEYQDAAVAKQLLAKIHQVATRPVTIMEVCGGQTHTIIAEGLDTLLPATVTLIHGPGCPVCVTPIGIIDQAIALATRPDTILCSYGDMLRVPGSSADLLSVKANGGDVRMVFSSLDAVQLARENPDKQVIFFAIGFETTAPTNAMAVQIASSEKLANFFLLTSQVLVPPALNAILADPDCAIQGFLAPGHVCTIMGYQEYEPIVKRYHTPIVVTGFEPVDILAGILEVIQAVNHQHLSVINAYSRLVQPQGNLAARKLMSDTFTVVDQEWRGMGVIPQSGLALQPAFGAFDAARLSPPPTTSQTPSVCIAGTILQGKQKPIDCPAFGTLCHPGNPLGAPMVSSEGACAAYYHAGRKGHHD